MTATAQQITQQWIVEARGLDVAPSVECRSVLEEHGMRGPRSCGWAASLLDEQASWRLSDGKGDGAAAGDQDAGSLAAGLEKAYMPVGDILSVSLVA
jgi:hypothetical protein